MLVFENKGEIDIKAVTTFGVSVKVTDNPIGYFGTGLKYAIAIVLRGGGSINIFSGKDKYEFTVGDTSIRGQSFGVIQMNGVPLGFTQDLGKNWEDWQAYRELYCNTLDEGGDVEQVEHSPRTRKGITRIVVEGLDEAYEDRDEHILSTEAIFATDSVEVHPITEGTEGGIVYLFGVKVYQMDTSTVFNYNFIRSVDLTEDRTVKAIETLQYDIMRALLEMDDVEEVEKYISAPTGSYENTLSFQHSSTPPSAAFKTLMRVKDTAETSYGTREVFNRVKLDVDDVDFKETPLDQEQKKVWEEVTAELTRLGFEADSFIFTDTLESWCDFKIKNDIIFINPELSSDIDNLLRQAIQALAEKDGDEVSFLITALLSYADSIKLLQQPVYSY